MKRLLAVIITLVLMTGCQNNEEINGPSTTSPVQSKSEIIHPIHMDKEDTVEVIGWFDQQSLLYAVTKDYSFDLYIHHLFTGEHTLFYSGEDDFYRIDASEHVQYFALQTINEDNQMHLSILNAEGDVVVEPDLGGEEYSIFWSPYIEEELMAVAYLPEWNQEVYHVDVTSLEVTKTGLQHDYLQWNASDSIAYLDWSLIPSIEAPLIQYQLPYSQRSDWYGSGLFFSSLYEDRLMVVKHHHNDDITYEFTDGERVLASLDIPILNTFSEQWWITSYAFDGDMDVFYYLRPYHAAEFISYKDGFELVAFDIQSGSSRVLKEVNAQHSMLLSKDGGWLLTGELKQELIHTEDGKTFRLF